MSQDTIRIAMWSGPRNISTAMMRSFGARPDTSVVDEPFYAAYLAQTKLVHPMTRRSTRIAAQRLARGRAVPPRTGSRRQAGVLSEAHDAPHAR